MSQMKFTLCLSIEGIEETVPVVVDYTYHRFASGRGESPDEPAHCEVQSMMAEGGEPIWLLSVIDKALERLLATTEFQALMMEDACEDGR